nr:NADH dehydrogenase subunit 4 [Asiopsocus sonorensis]
MLKHLCVLISIVPFCFTNWLYMQLGLSLVLMFLMMELGHFHYVEGLFYSFGFDLMSYMLIILSVWICLLMVNSSEIIYMKKLFNEMYGMLVLLLGLFLFFSFYSMNFFMFYLFFESSLIPIFMIIMGWGYQSERVQAGMYMLMYTLISSLPLLLMIFILYKMFMCLNLYMLEVKFLTLNYIMYMSMLIGFLVKLPMYMLHLWLPKAHVEAPVAGSMILAGVLLKLGGYGVMRVIQLGGVGLFKPLSMLIMISVVGGSLVSLNCLRQVDMKLMIAYSSVGHMSMFLMGVCTMNEWGTCMGLGMMLSHGLCSSGLFFLINVLYERSGVRSIYFMKGFSVVMSKMVLWMFLFCVLNVAAPPSLNLLSEIGLFISGLGWSGKVGLFVFFMSVTCASYSFYLFSSMSHGEAPNLVYCSNMDYVREHLIFFMHWIPVNLIVIMGSLFINWI